MNLSDSGLHGFITKDYYSLRCRSLRGLCKTSRDIPTHYGYYETRSYFHYY